MNIKKTAVLHSKAGFGTPLSALTCDIKSDKTCKKILQCLTQNYDCIQQHFKEPLQYRTFVLLHCKGTGKKKPFRMSSGKVVKGK